MGFFELLFIAVGLSADAFAVSVCKGLSMGRARIKNSLIVSTWFGGFQMLMPLVGFFLGRAFEKYITAFDHWIAFALLCAIGAGMIKEAFSKPEKETEACSLGVKHMFVMAVATSIDALAAGITFGFLLSTARQLITAVVMIGVSTFVLSWLGVAAGGVFGAKYKSKAEFVGGVILIGMGVKILLEHLGVIGF
ncbi:MAG: manganese efflux pump [Clostridiales bacterium]|jgi:putative Mn2+ efflux pump MntP|nr:manganese efflux pump [Clostridiales bacterium]